MMNTTALIVILFFFSSFLMLLVSDAAVIGTAMCAVPEVVEANSSTVNNSSAMPILFNIILYLGYTTTVPIQADLTYTVFHMYRSGSVVPQISWIDDIALLPCTVFYLCSPSASHSGLTPSGILNLYVSILRSCSLSGYVTFRGDPDTSMFVCAWLLVAFFCVFNSLVLLYFTYMSSYTRALCFEWFTSSLVILSYIPLGFDLRGSFVTGVIAEKPHWIVLSALSIISSLAFCGYSLRVWPFIIYSELMPNTIALVLAIVEVYLRARGSGPHVQGGLTEPLLQ